ncbi:hypothetical protein AJ78_09058, partial [Emergomyces pasteurianus Ep9510]
MPISKASEGSPLRRSRRIAAMRTEEAGEKPARSKRQLSAETSLSELSTIPESPESRGNKINKARDRINRYVPGQRAHTKRTDHKLIPCLNAFLDWLPAEGVDSLIHDVESCNDDDEALYCVFENLASALLQP